MTGPGDNKMSTTQKLSDLVEWFLADRGVELRFVPNKLRKGRIAPEWDFQYWINGRCITERGLAFLITCELARLNYRYTLASVLSHLTEHAWRHYVANCEYPEWLKPAKVELKRPPGRPRKRPVTIALPPVAPPHKSGSVTGKY